jgi:hypothetical protein
VFLKEPFLGHFQSSFVARAQFEEQADYWFTAMCLKFVIQFP